jgi:hypothetical protein
VILLEYFVGCGQQLREVEQYAEVNEMCGGHIFLGRPEQKLKFVQLNEV